jgi:energy-coupling factor transport system permease protein
MLICVLSATIAQNMIYVMGLVLLIAIFSLICGKVLMAIYGIIGYIICYLLTLSTIYFEINFAQVVLMAFLGLLHKIYPCAFFGGIIIETTKISEFISAMNKLYVPKSLTIPLAIMLRYIPTIREDWHFIKDAMRLRDVSPTLSGLLTCPAKTLECVYVPMLMAASKAADELSIAAVTRGIENPLPRTCLTEIRIRVADVIIFICFATYFVAGLFLQKELVAT